MAGIAPSPRDLWRVAALSMMRPEELSAVLQGADAIEWVRAAADCGIAEAQVRLGRVLLEDGDASAAFACFRRAADGGDRDGRNMLGRCFENGWGMAKDFAQAVCHYRIAADAGLDWAQYNLGHMLLSGSGVAQNRDAAFARYRQAAVQGHVRAMNLVGRCYEEGWGTARDLERAKAWYCRSAQGGYFRGAYNYADLLAAEDCWRARLLVPAAPRLGMGAHAPPDPEIACGPALLPLRALAIKPARLPTGRPGRTTRAYSAGIR